MSKKSKSHLLLLSCMLVFVTSTLASAQVSYGLKLLAGQKIGLAESYGKRSVHYFTPAGIGATVNIPLSEKLGLQPELTYLTPVRELFNYHIVSLPLMLTYQATEHLSFEAGPSLEREFLNIDNSRQDSYFKPDYNLGANLGVGIMLSDQWTLGFRYTYETFRTKYVVGGFTSDQNDPFLGSLSGREPGRRDTAIIASIRYKLR